MEIAPRDLEKYATKCANDPKFFIKYFLKLNLTEYQEEIIDSIEKNPLTVCCIARQMGKTTALAAYVVWKLLYGKGRIINDTPMTEDILLAAPTEPQSKLIYDKIKNWILSNELIRDFVDGDITMQKIRMKNGNICRTISAAPTANIRGYSPTLLLCDEAGSITDEVFNSVLLPMCGTTRAHVVQIGTPLSRNHFYRSIYEDPSAYVIFRTYEQCPFLDAAARKSIYNLRSDAGGTSPISLWEQEYLCKFQEMSSSAFPSELVYSCLDNYKYSTAIEGLLEPPEKGADYVCGIDLGRENDSTVMVVLRRDKLPYRIVHIESHVHQPYTYLMYRLNMLNSHYQFSAINVDQTGEKGWGDLATEFGIPINPIIFTLDNKMAMNDNLRVLFEKRILRLPRAATTLYSQIVNQQYEMTMNGKKRYYHSYDSHDDELYALALAAMALTIDTSSWDGGGNTAQCATDSAVVPLGRPPLPLNIKERDRELLKEWNAKNIRKDTSDAGDCIATGNTVHGRDAWDEGYT